MKIGAKLLLRIGLILILAPSVVCYFFSFGYGTLLRLGYITSTHDPFGAPVNEFIWIRPMGMTIVLGGIVGFILIILSGMTFVSSKCRKTF